MPDDQLPLPLTEPIFESFTIRMSPGSDSGMILARARHALDDSLQEVLGRSAEGWTAEAVHASWPGMVDLIPPELGALTVKEAWDVTYRLQDQPSVIDAEPSFEIVADSGDLPGDGPEVDEFLVGASDAPPIFSKSDSDWCAKLILAPQAWNVPPHPGGDGEPAGTSHGDEILVGHPDSGYREHFEIQDELDRFLEQRGVDFIGDDFGRNGAAGGHGLGTSSVLMSSVGGPGTKFVTGIAPKASIIPYRVTKPHLFIPSPVLFASGMRRLAKAIFQAVDEGCQVISISLGWLPNEKVHDAVKHAFEKDVIVVAAAGNDVRFFVVWPAAYKEVISCAGCTSKRRRWSKSSRGKRVDITGPAEDVWKAGVEGDNRVVTQSSGTSFAAASVAGVAALWLGRWGRKRLIRHLNGEFRLTTLFRHMLTANCDPEPEGADGLFGKGIVNAEKLLQAQLPSLEELRASEASVLEAAALSMAEPTGLAGIRAVADAFSDVPRSALQSQLSRLMNVPATQLEDRLHGVGRELVFQILTDPAAREAVFAGGEAADSMASTASAAAETMTQERLRLAPLSDRLRSRLEA